jgi:hypothetical protein
VEVNMSVIILEPTHGLQAAIQAAELALSGAGTPEKLLELMELETERVKGSIFFPEDDVDMPQWRVDSSFYGEWLDDYMRRAGEQYHKLFAAESLYRQHYLMQLSAEMRQRMMESYMLTLVALRSHVEC